MTNKAKHRGKKDFFLILITILFSRVLESHVKSCLIISHTKSVLLPEENKYVNFQNFERLTKASFIIYGDFECVLIPSTDNIDIGPNAKNYQDHIVCSYGCK